MVDGVISSSEHQLCGIIHQGAESRGLDYKRAMIWNKDDNASRCAIVKDVLAMANTDGGYLVIGVGEVNGQLDWHGMSEVELKSWDSTKINSFVQSYAGPPINIVIHSVECRGRRYAVVVVPQFSASPHICQKDHEGHLRRGAI